ncbi:MFS transporter [Pseudomonas auratipiscis]|uniref:MFS transporter n=1 Tax=Pseudomonas auratipiscis TaxID=3115853 RepID=A0AB35WMS5_9PSED|nr:MULTISPECIES: MFS transporter [unclassified Pseudomonas]MEE1865158.1 MFS transporter [Pseudomonas sp. 120P]MEE1955901.1 MFS transporter [Pseudomonas sp. 119P]
MSSTTGAIQQQPRTKRWWGLAVLMLPVLLVTVDNTVLGFALPKIAEALQPTASQQLWMIDAYSLVLAGLLVSMGSLGDRIGHRKLLLIGSLGFATVSVMTAYSANAGQLIAGRACMGIFGAMLMPSTLALIRSLFEDREERRLAVAIWATTLTVGSALGPLVGGILLEFFDWGAIFLLAVPVLVPLLLLGPWLLPESEADASGPLDPLSILQSMVALGALVYGIKHLASAGLDAQAVAAFAIGAASGWLFVRRQLRLPVPLMDLALFRNKTFSGSVAINLMSLAFLVGFVFFATQFLQIVLDMSAFKASLALVPGQIMAIVVGMLVVPVAQRVSAQVLIPVLVAFTGGAFLLVAGLGINLIVLVVAFALLNIGVGAIATVSNDIILSAAPPTKAGAASAISETAYEVGVVLGTTVLGGVVTAYYRGALQLPAFLTPLQERLASETLAGAHTVAATLGTDQASELMAIAGRAFEGGIGLMSWLTFVLAALAIVIARVTLKTAPTVVQPELS